MRLASWLCLGVCFSVNAQTLDEAVIQAITTGPEVGTAIHNKQAAEQQLIKTYAGYLPVVALSADYGPETSDNTTTRAAGYQSRTLQRSDLTITASQNIFNGLGTKFAVEGDTHRAQSAAYDAQGSIEETASNAVSAYLDVLEKQMRVQLAQENLKEHQQLFSRIELRSKSGVGRASDLDQAQGRFALARTDYMSEQAGLRDAQARYQQVVGLMPKELQLPEVPQQFLPETQESAVTLALASNPRLRSSISAVSSATADYRGSYAAFLPQLSVQWLNQDTNRSGGVDEQSKTESTLLQVNYNLFNGGADKAHVKQTAEQLAGAKESRNGQRRQIEEKIRVSWNAFTTADEQLKYFKEHVTATTRTREAYQKQFAIGQRTLVDLLDSENELYHARLDEIGAEMRRLTGQYQLLASMGRLLPSLGLAQPEEAYFDNPGLGGVVSNLFKAS